MTAPRTDLPGLGDPRLALCAWRPPEGTLSGERCLSCDRWFLADRRYVRMRGGFSICLDCAEAGNTRREAAGLPPHLIDRRGYPAIEAQP